MKVCCYNVRACRLISSHNDAYCQLMTKRQDVVITQRSQRLIATKAFDHCSWYDQKAHRKEAKLIKGWFILKMGTVPAYFRTQYAICVSESFSWFNYTCLNLMPWKLELQCFQNVWLVRWYKWKFAQNDTGRKVCYSCSEILIYRII